MAAVALAAVDQREIVEYPPDVIDHYLKCWDELESRAEHMRSPSDYDIARPAPTRGRFTPKSWMEIRADITRAHAQLHVHGLAWRVIDLRRGGRPLGLIATMLHIRKHDVCGAHRAALERMADYLNG